MPARNAAEAGIDLRDKPFDDDKQMTTSRMAEIQEVGQGHFSSNRPRSTTAENAEELNRIKGQLAFRWNEREAEKPQRP